MNTATTEALKHFTGLDTWSSTHPSDSERFNQFIITAYNNKDFSIDQDIFLESFPDLNEHLEEIARDLYGKYENGIELLRQFNG